jgi:PiT family inorganic phosphate transporter
MHFLQTAGEHFGAVSWGQLTLVVWLLLGLALLFDFLNGFHDAANSVATVVSTRVLSPRTAVVWAAFFNFVAFLVFHLSVAATMGKGIIDPSVVNNRVIAATLLAACFWDVLTWYWGLPTSSSHALIGGLVGAALANTGVSALLWAGIGKTVLFMFLAPLIGLVTGLAFAVAVAWLFRRATPRRVDRLFRRGQLLSASFYSLGHGGNDAQKTMGIIFVLLLAAAQANPELPWRGRFALTDSSFKALHDGPAMPDDVLAQLAPLRDVRYSTQKEFTAALGGALSATEIEPYEQRIVKAADQAQVPTEVVLACHVAMGIGTLFGGWRIVKTMGQKIIRLRPVDGFCAESGAAATLVLTIFGGVPVSTTHTITGSIVGVGSLKRLSAVRWGVAGRVVWAWVLTIPGTAVVAAAVWWLLFPVG